MTREVRNAVGKPDSSVFVLRCILYGVILAAMLKGGPILFEKLMVPMAADGMAGAWNAVLIPLAVVLMALTCFSAGADGGLLPICGSITERRRPMV